MLRVLGFWVRLGAVVGCRISGLQGFGLKVQDSYDPSEGSGDHPHKTPSWGNYLDLQYFGLVSSYSGIKTFKCVLEGPGKPQTTLDPKP